MGTYVSLAKLTCDGYRNYKEGPKKHEEAKRAIESAGGKLLAAYAVIGAYDFIFITEFPDERKAAGVLLKSSASGEINFQTMVAIPMEEFVSLTQQV